MLGRKLGKRKAVVRAGVFAGMAKHAGNAAVTMFPMYFNPPVEEVATKVDVTDVDLGHADSCFGWSRLRNLVHHVAGLAMSGRCFAVPTKRTQITPL